MQAWIQDRSIFDKYFRTHFHTTKRGSTLGALSEWSLLPTPHWLSRPASTASDASVFYPTFSKGWTPKEIEHYHCVLTFVISCWCLLEVASFCCLERNSNFMLCCGSGAFIFLGVFHILEPKIWKLPGIRLFFKSWELARSCKLLMSVWKQWSLYFVRGLAENTKGWNVSASTTERLQATNRLWHGEGVAVRTCDLSSKSSQSGISLSLLSCGVEVQHKFPWSCVQRFFLLLQIPAGHHSRCFLTYCLNQQPVAAQTVAHSQHDVLKWRKACIVEYLCYKLIYQHWFCASVKGAPSLRMICWFFHLKVHHQRGFAQGSDFASTVEWVWVLVRVTGTV